MNSSNKTQVVSTSNTCGCIDDNLKHLLYYQNLCHRSPQVVRFGLSLSRGAQGVFVWRRMFLPTAWRAGSKVKGDLLTFPAGLSSIVAGMNSFVRHSWTDCSPRFLPTRHIFFLSRALFP